MKIAIVLDWYLPRIGGLELHVRDLARQFVKHGHKVDIVCSTAGPTDSESEGVRIHRLQVPLLPKYDCAFTTDAYVALSEVLNRVQPDVVHTHSAYSVLSHMGAMYAHREGIPSLTTECSYFDGATAAFFRGLGKFLPWNTWSTVLSGVSGVVAEHLRLMAGRDEAFVLHNGIDLSRWQNERREPTRPRVTSVMRFTVRKRPIDVVRTIPRVHAQLPPELRPIFTIVGDGPQMAHVRREASRLGVTKDLELLGFQPRERVAEILSESTLFALPTQKEAMSIATLESLAAGCPAVAMNLGGVRDVVEHGREGFLADDLEEFADYIAQLIRDHDLRQQMADRTRSRLQRFAWNNVVARHENLFRLAKQRIRGAQEIQLDELGYLRKAA